MKNFRAPIEVLVLAGCSCGFFFVVYKQFFAYVQGRTSNALSYGYNANPQFPTLVFCSTEGAENWTSKAYNPDNLINDNTGTVFHGIECFANCINAATETFPISIHHICSQSTAPSKLVWIVICLIGKVPL